jgi:hypothetical protein
MGPLCSEKDLQLLTGEGEGKKWKIGRCEGVKVRKGQEPGKLEISKFRVGRVGPGKMAMAMDWGRLS